MYNRGTLAQFNAWHEPCRVDNALLEGVFYSFTTAHPTNQDDYVWEHCAYPEGQSYSLAEVESEGFVV